MISLICGIYTAKQMNKHKILHSSFKSVVSVSYSAPVIPYPSSTGLQSHMFWGFFFLVQDPQAGEFDVGLRHLIPWEEPLQS